MRNAIKYYYGIDVDELERYENGYIFKNYILKELRKEFNYELYDYLLRNNIYIYKIIYNKDNNLITIIDKKSYILLLKDTSYELNLDLIIKNLYRINNFDKVNWSKLWEYKVDYFEKNINDKFKIYDLSSFYYYIGLSENAIKYYKENEEEGTYSISHDRISSINDYFSPDNIIIDNISRDIAEYIKYAFFNDKLDINKLINILNSNLFKKSDLIILYSRLLFPTYYYDCIENNISVEKYSSKIIQYEKLLVDIYIIVSKKYKVPKIEWLIKKYSN